MPADVLVVSAHPDDAELFCGGTIAKLVSQGRRVLLADLSRGERATRGTAAEREAEAAEAARILGVERVYLDCGDTLIENTEANRLKVIQAIREWRPAVVLTNDPHDRHPDHRKAHALVRDAAFYSGVGGVDTGQPRHRPPALFCFTGNSLGAAPMAQFAVDITEVFDQKLRALKAFRSQFFNPEYDGPPTFISSENFWKTIEARARMAGAQIGVTYAEAFTSGRPLPVQDMVTLAGG